MAEESIYVESGPDAGKIKSPKVAGELAYLEKPARDREIALEKQGRLTENQRMNIAIMEEVKEEFPHAYKSTIDNQGREIMRLNDETGDRQTYFTQEGVVMLVPDFASPVPGLKFDKDGELLSEVDKAQKAHQSRFDEFTRFSVMSLENSDVCRTIKGILKQSEEIGIRQERKAAPSKLVAIRANLFGKK